MTSVLITGAGGFIGRNLQEALCRMENVDIVRFVSQDDLSSLASKVLAADFIFHLAGVNRPKSTEEFCIVNTELTRSITSLLIERGKKTPLVFASSIQAALDNPYGNSKRQAEDCVFEYGEKTGAPVYVFRLTNIFGKWSKPNYNSVVATFCYNISHNIEIVVTDSSREIELAYIDDVIADFVELLKSEHHFGSKYYREVVPTFRLTLGDLVNKLYQLKAVRESLLMPDLSDSFMERLYATYLSYLDGDDFSYPLDWKTDSRGSLAELIKSEHFGQIFVSKTHSGVIRGNHYHNTKIEKFCVLQGNAAIRFRHLFSDKILTYQVNGEIPVVVDIPPGYTHSIENLSGEEMIVLFWASQIFDPNRPDTYHLPVVQDKK